jgi:serine/threonine-protein kinase
VVRILGVSGADAPVPYLAMEYLHGHDLAHYLRRRRRLGHTWTVELAEQVGSVIDAARENRIVHRDLKPQNLFRAETTSGEALWKVLDFGVSKLGEHSGTLTQGRVVGTPSYMAPEQARGRTVDHRADLYALAGIVYRCVTGRPPFSGKDMPVILHEVVYTMPPRPGELADLDTDMDLVLAIGLAKRAADRFDTGAELADALDLAFSGRLEEATRRRARALLAEMPWGKHRGNRAL